jgi:DNA-binding beta-propeller fold protein YncE
VNRRELLAAAAALPFALRTGVALAGGSGVALVTADTEASVVAVDLRSGQVLHSIATLPGPRSIERVGPLAVVAHTAYGAVSILDQNRVVSVLRDFSEPRYTAAHPDGRHAFVTDSALSGVVAVDVVAGHTLGRVRLTEWARHLTIDPTGRTLWVGLGNASDRVAVVDVRDPARPRLSRYVRPPLRAHDVGFAPGGRAVWVTSGATRGLAVHDARTHEVLLRLPAGSPPQHVTFGDGVVYVTSGGDGTLHVRALRDGRLLRAKRIPVGSYNVQDAGGRVVAPSLDRGTLALVLARGARVRVMPVARSCHDACVL